MIHLIRVYKDGRVIHAEAYDHDERAVDDRHPWERCRCIPSPLWYVRQQTLAEEFGRDNITTTPIYLSRKAP